VAGANRADHHTTRVVLGRDFGVDVWADLAQVRDGDPCPRDGGRLEIGRSVEVGHTFQLGTRYSDPLKATFVDEDGIERPFVMGCYGIGVSRIVSAVVEQHHDEAGIAWPRAVAPYEACVLIANRDDERVVAEAGRIYAELMNRGVEVVIDDRDRTAGEKFADADLIGYPVQVVAGKRGVSAGIVDLKVRATGERSSAPLESATEATVELLAGSP
jgi:prolyl-tRNA synthetase